MPVRNLRDGTLKIADSGGTGGANVVTVDLEEGNLRWTERRPAHIIKDRGALSHARKAPDEGVEIEFGMMFQSLSRHATPTPYEALKGVDDASAWVSDEPNSDVYAAIVEFTIDDPAGGADEVLTFERFVTEEVSFEEGEEFDRLTVRGRAPITTPTVA